MTKRTKRLYSVGTYVKSFIQFRSKYDVLLVAIIVVGIVLRFYQFPERYGFDYDASRDANMALYGAEHLLFPSLGPASALGPFHFGPWYYYQLILFQLFFPLPYAPWIYIGILSCITIVVGYKLGESIQSKLLGLIIAAFISFSPSQIAPGTGLSNPNLVVLPSFVTLWLFVKLIKENLSWKWSFVFAFVLGVGINNHYQMLPLLLLPLVLFFVTKQAKKTYVLSVLFGFILAFLPLGIYELLHGFPNAEGLWFYLSEGKNAVYIPNSWTIYLRDFWPTFLASTSGLPFLMALGLLVLSGIYYVLAVKNKQKDHILLFLAGVFIIECLYLRYFSANRESYYLLFLHPFLFLFYALGLSYFVTHQKNRMVQAGGYILITSVLLMTFMSSMQTIRSPESYTEVTTLVERIAAAYPGQKIQLYDCSERTRGRSMGVLYLLKSRQMIDTEGIHLGLYDRKNCSVTIEQEKSIKNIVLSDIDVPRGSLQDYAVIELDPTNAAGFTPVTGETVYKQTMTKWFHQ